MQLVSGFNPIVRQGVDEYAVLESIRLVKELNTARQAAITQELAEISGGAEALNG